MLHPFLISALLLVPAAPAPTSGDAGVDREPLTVGPQTFHRRLLANGLRCVAVQDDDERVSVFVVLGVGNRNETPDITGLAHLVEHAMFAGTTETGTDEHERIVVELGGEGNAFTREDYTLYYDHHVPAESLPRVLALEADRLRGLTFEEQAFLHERGRLEREEAYTHRPSDARVQELEARAFLVHNYRAGLRDERGHTRAPALDAATARAFYDRYYHPRNACVVVVGAMEPGQMLDAIEAAFGDLPGGPATPPPPTEPWIESPRSEAITTELPRDRVELVWLVPGAGDSSAASLKLLAHLVGRARLSDGTPVETFLEERVDRRLFRVAASGANAQEELAAIVQAARTTAPQASELELVRGLVRDEYASRPLRARPYFSLAATFGVSEVHDQARVLAEWAGQVDAQTALDVRAAATRWLDPGRCVTVVLEGTGEPPAPLPDDPAALSRAALDAIDAGDHLRAIEAYTKLLEGKPNRMNTVIYFAERGQIQMELRDYDAAIADFDAALAVVDYPAVRTLLEEAHARKKAALRGEFGDEEDSSSGEGGDGR